MQVVAGLHVFPPTRACQSSWVLIILPLPLHFSHPPSLLALPCTKVFLGVDRKALALLKKLLAFDPAERPTAEQALADPYFAGLHYPSR